MEMYNDSDCKQNMWILDYWYDRWAGHGCSGGVNFFSIFFISWFV